MDGSSAVKATVRSVGVTNGLRIAVLSVDDVILGEQDAKGKAISFPLYEKGGLGALIIHPSLEIGEEGIWLVRCIKGHYVIDTVQMQKWHEMNLPARKKISEQDYDAALEWLSTVVAVSQVNGQERKQLLQTLERSKNRRTAEWARLQREKSSGTDQGHPTGKDGERQ